MIQTRARSAWAQVCALLFPSRCIGCGRRDVDLCLDCRASLPHLAPHRCPLCAMPAGRIGLCDRCRRVRHQLDGVHVEYAYGGPVRTAVHRLKYRQGRYLAPLLAELCIDAVANRPFKPDVLVAVPLGSNRLRTRGYNQSTLIATEIGERLGVPLVDALVRTRETRPQTKLSMADRRLNVRGAFGPAPGVDVRNLRVALVDDVMTTGATLEACATVLKTAGADRVFGLPVAREP